MAWVQGAVLQPLLLLLATLVVDGVLLSSRYGCHRRWSLSVVVAAVEVTIIWWLKELARWEEDLQMG
jgi:hypothetical protein